jgi:hypothetical protein
MNLWVTTSPRLASQPVIRLLSEWPHRPRRGARPTPWTSTRSSEHRYVGASIVRCQSAGRTDEG